MGFRSLTLPASLSVADIALLAEEGLRCHLGGVISLVCLILIWISVLKLSFHCTSIVVRSLDEGCCKVMAIKFSDEGSETQFNK